MRVLPFLSRFDRYSDQKILVVVLVNEHNVQIALVQSVGNLVALADLAALGNRDGVNSIVVRIEHLVLGQIHVLVLQSDGVSGLIT